MSINFILDIKTKALKVYYLIHKLDQKLLSVFLCKTVITLNLKKKTHTHTQNHAFH